MQLGIGLARVLSGILAAFLQYSFMNLEQLFWEGLHGSPDYMPDGNKRARHIVADAIRIVARKQERSPAARMHWAAGRIEAGWHPSKKVISQIGKQRLMAVEKEFKLIAQRLNAP